MEWKGSRTERNLQEAFAGESMARNRYLFYAERARQEQYPQVAEVFDRMADNEGMHAKLMYQKLGGVGSTTQNLQDSIGSEFQEWRTLYPEFARIAREEGFDAIGILFEHIAEIEHNHELTFMQLLVELGSQPNLEKGEPEKRIQKTVPGYRCVFCGAVFEEKMDVCQVCQAIGSFEETTITKEIT